MKHLLIAAAVLAVGSARAALVTEIYTPTILTTAIADNQPVLTSFLTTVNNSAIQALTEISISFELSGTTAGAGFASDIFASLLKSPVGVAPTVSDPMAVLLNRVGITGSDPIGFGYDGWNIVLRDSAATDIHGQSLVSGVLTGTFQPDGRSGATDAGRPFLLGTFNGGGGNGDWRLNVGDLAQNGSMQLVGWSLSLTGEVPEASTWAAGLAVLGLLGWNCWRARRR